jgi:hypothetical protein
MIILSSELEACMADSISAKSTRRKQAKQSRSKASVDATYQARMKIVDRDKADKLSVSLIANAARIVFSSPADSFIEPPRVVEAIKHHNIYLGFYASTFHGRCTASTLTIEPSKLVVCVVNKSKVTNGAQQDLSTYNVVSGSRMTLLISTKTWRVTFQ